MKTMKYVSMVILFTLLSTGLSFAQKDMQGKGPQGPPPLPSAEEVDGIIEDLVWELTLSEDQAKDFEQVFKAHMKEMVTMRDEMEKQRKEKMESIRANFEEDLSGILNEAQLEKFKAIHPRQDDRMRGPDKAKKGCRGKNGHHPPCRR
jgi:polyhydroxyalkanoate synthesis regulator phasin